MRRLAAASLMALGLVAGSASAAVAGEYTGQPGNPENPRQGQPASACSFSGLDQPDNIEGNPPGRDDDDNTGPGRNEDGVASGVRVQNYGQIVQAGGKAFAPSPGAACNPTRGFEE